MVFSSQYQIDIPSVDVLSYLFDTTGPTEDTALYLSAENPEWTISKLQLRDFVCRLAGGLRKIAGVEDKDVVLVISNNSVWYPVITLGAICAGGVFTGANPRYTETELIHQLNVSGAKCVFTDSERLGLAVRAAKSVGIPRTSIFLIDDEKDPRSIRSLLNHGAHQWERLSDAEVLSQRPAILNFSSGTTGRPKACVITHRNLVANSEQTLHLDRVSRTRQSDPTFATGDIHCAYVPLYHAIGLLTFSIINVRRGCSTVIMEKFDLRLLLDSIERFRITFLFLVPPVAVMLTKTPILSEYDISSVKYLLCGAAPLSPETSAKVEDIFSANKARCRQGWGMTEATMAVTLFAPDEFDPSHRGVGYITPNMQIKVIKDNGEEAGYDEEGEALIRGPNIFRGYYRNEVASREAWTEDGWLKTGDIVTIQPDGLLSIVDRKKELIKVNGFQVAPSEIEGCLLECPGVQDCAVIRVEQYDNISLVLGLFLGHADRDDVTAESILAFMEKRLSNHKRLSGGVVFTDAIPKSPSGKIIRRMLKDQHDKQRAANL